MASAPQDVILIVSVQFGVYLGMDADDVTEPLPWGGGKVYCEFDSGRAARFQLNDQGEGIVTIESLDYQGVFLRMDGRGILVPLGDGGGTVNCQYGAYGWEQFRVHDQGDGTVAIESAEFPNVFLRMDGRDTQAHGGPGTVNCQYGAYAWEKFRLQPR